MQPNLNLQELKERRTNLLVRLNQDPENFVKTFYSQVSDKYFSPYLNLNNSDLCCLVGRRSLPTGQEAPICYSAISQIATGSHGTVYSVGSFDQNYALKVRKIGKLFIEYSPVLPNSERRVRRFSGECGFPLQFAQSSIGSDDFTNEILISYLLEYLMEETGALTAGLNNLVNTFDSTVCNVVNPGIFFRTRENLGVLLMEKGLSSFDQPFSATFAPFQREINWQGEFLPIFEQKFILDCFRQLVFILGFLEKTFNFSHGDLKVGNVVFFPERYFATYQGRQVVSDFTLKIIDFEKSAITVNLAGKDHRIYNRSSLADNYLRIRPFEPQISKRLFTEPEGFQLSEQDSREFYTLPGFTTSQIYAASRHRATPFYQNFDIYTVFISFLLTPSFFIPIFSSSELKKRIWDPLFLPEESSQIYQNLYSAQGNKNPNSTGEILDLLKGFQLKCNILDLLLDSLF